MHFKSYMNIYEYPFSCYSLLKVSFFFKQIWLWLLLLIADSIENIASLLDSKLIGLKIVWRYFMWNFSVISRISFKGALEFLILYKLKITFMILFFIYIILGLFLKYFFCLKIIKIIFHSWGSIFYISSSSASMLTPHKDLSKLLSSFRSVRLDNSFRSSSSIYLKVAYNPA